jgi:hypothetical protein
MGGRQWVRDAAWQAWADSRQDKQIKHYNHCLPYTGCTPTHKHIAIVYSGFTGHYGMVTAPITNKKVATMPIQVTLPDGASIKSSHTWNLILPQLPETAKKVHVIPGLSTSSLLYVGQLVDADCSITFDKTKVQILHKKAKILEGQRNLRNGPWTVDLQGNKSQPPLNFSEPKYTSTHCGVKDLQTMHTCEAHIIYECSNKRDLVQYLHAAAFIPVPDTWLKATRAGHFATWPDLIEDLVRKHLPKELATIKGHLSQRRKNLRSTTKTIAAPVTDSEDSADSDPTPTNIKIHHVFAALVDVGKLYGDLTGRFTIQPSRGH